MKVKPLIALAAVVAILQPPIAAAETPPQAAPATQPQAAGQATPPARTPGPAAARTGETAWLGIALGDVPDALYTQLEQIIPPGQGVLVTGVMPDSPAAKAGIHTNDVLLAYDDQKLYSPRQLAGLVRADHPDKTVAIQLVEQGKLKTLHVTLGKQSQAASMPPFGPFGWHTPMRLHRHMPYPPQMAPGSGSSGKPLAWSAFESVQVRTLPNGRYRAEVTYKDNDNNSKQFAFEGTQEQIRNEIQKNASLPEDKKQALLEALNMNPQTMFKPPMFEGNPYADSFFQGNPFDEDFFRDFPPMHVPPGFRPFFQPSTPGSRNGIF
jgi:membrane-associated protease RseP (regulator of RpoE activity)